MMDNLEKLNDCKFCKTIRPLTLDKGKRWIGGNFWENKKVLTVQFHGSPDKALFVMNTLKEIEKHCSITFKEVFNNAIIRVTFDPTDGAWSYVGKDVATIPANEATMNLGWLDKAVVLHEFMHTMGLQHEHQNYNKGIKWNKPVVIKALSGAPNNWDLKTIEHNMFETYPNLEASVFDPKSIMLYPFPKSWTIDGFSSQGSTELSAMDIEFLKSHYPKPEPVVVFPTEPTNPTNPVNPTNPTNPVVKIGDVSTLKQIIPTFAVVSQCSKVVLFNIALYLGIVNKSTNYAKTAKQFLLDKIKPFYI
jgi:hypothetical protein